MTHAERKSDCKYEVEREGRKRKRMRVRNEGENRLKKTHFETAKISPYPTKETSCSSGKSLCHTHTHAPLSFFVDWYSPFFSPETCRALLLPWCVSAVCSPCVCVCVSACRETMCWVERFSAHTSWCRVLSFVAACYMSRELKSSGTVSLCGGVCVCTRVSVCVFFLTYLRIFPIPQSTQSTFVCLLEFFMSVCVPDVIWA